MVLVVFARCGGCKWIDILDDAVSLAFLTINIKAIKMKRIAGYMIMAFTMLVLCGSTPQKCRILIIGDSISIGYTPFVQKALKHKAIVAHNPGNGQFTANGISKLADWIGSEKWDIIQFNWGLWDLCYRNSSSNEQGNRDKINGKLTTSPTDYGKNL